ncbi:MAG: hypothetical protein U0559_09080 [Anaerolineae bacterium]
MLTQTPDLLFVLSTSCRLCIRAAVVTVHDLGYLFFPETHPTGQRLYLDGRHAGTR